MTTTITFVIFAVAIASPGLITVLLGGIATPLQYPSTAAHPAPDGHWIQPSH